MRPENERPRSAYELRAGTEAVISRPSEPAQDEGENWRLLPLKGANNLRDLGGYETKCGRTVKRGLIYRSGHLHRLTDADLVQLTRLGISEITDFRGPSEVLDEPDRMVPEVNYTFLPVDIAGSDLREKVGRVIRGSLDMDLSAYMKDVYCQFVENYTGVFSRWMKNLARNHGSLPQIFHCTAGKDRTGFAAAILLTALGVPEKQVVDDYLKTNLYTRRQMEKTIRRVNRLSLNRGAGEVLRPLLGADENYLQKAFDTVTSRWGNFESYFLNSLGLNQSDIISLKERFLEVNVQSPGRPGC